MDLFIILNLYIFHLGNQCIHLHDQITAFCYPWLSVHQIFLSVHQQMGYTDTCLQGMCLCPDNQFLQVTVK